MKIVFIHSHKFRKIGSKIFSLGGLSNSVLRRYIKEEDDSLTVISRIINEEKSNSNYSEITDERIKVKNFFDIKFSGLKNEILNADVIIIRLPCLLGNIAVKYAKKYNKKYLIEVVGCTFDSYFNHGIVGKIIAPISYIFMRENVKRAPYVLYVSNHFLQSRYPNNGKNVACSDVLIENTSESILNNRLQKIENNRECQYVIGTIGALNVKYKGQKYVIRALKKLKDMRI